MASTDSSHQELEAIAKAQEIISSGTVAGNVPGMRFARATDRDRRTGLGTFARAGPNIMVSQA